MQTRPIPGSAATPEEFLEALRQLRAWAGQPSLRTLNTLAGTDPESGEPPTDLLPVSTLSDNLAGKRLPNPPRLSFVVAFVTACMRADGSQTQDQIADEADRWTQAWLALSPDAPQPLVPASAPTPADTVPDSALTTTDTLLESIPPPDDTFAHDTPAPEDAAPENDLAQKTAPTSPAHAQRQTKRRRLPVMAWLLGAVTGAVVVGLITLVTTDTPPQQPTASKESTDVPSTPPTPPPSPSTRAEKTPADTTGRTPVSEQAPRPDSKPAPTPSPSGSKRPSPSPSRPAPSPSPSDAPTTRSYPPYYDSWKSYLPSFSPRP
ncbi:hypothetical protein [Actinomadura sp. CNU-125]|uniref:hypothetical protein n=1 Tax=Actinomadura sp. CNU-125 TaxID=1904961 RepID=UPI000B2EE51B|nr:hypothetical protein [Actinomadura sp. CNU-125]